MLFDPLGQLPVVTFGGTWGVPGAGLPDGLSEIYITLMFYIHFFKHLKSWRIFDEK